jgi:hypothetical protein
VVAVRIVVAILGALVVMLTVLSAIRTTVLPRGVPARLARAVFVITGVGFSLWAGRAADYARRDRIFASYGPISLLLTLQVWLGFAYFGFAAMQWATMHDRAVPGALSDSGSALFTLGFDAPHGGFQTAVAFGEASTGLLIVTLLISYLPAIYASFSRREAMVTKMEVRAGSPPNAVDMLTRAWRLSGFERLTTAWVESETWFVDIEETHTSFPSLVFFRSPQPDHGWVTTAGAILDAASIKLSSVDVAPDVDAQLCIRAGYLSLGRIAAYFGVRYSEKPAYDDPITVTRSEYDAAMAMLEEAGLPLKADREQAWRDFRGWRVNYDRVLVGLAGLTLSPYAPWSSDRSLPDGPARLRFLGRLGGAPSASSEPVG